MNHSTKTAILFTGLICSEHFDQFIECCSTIKELKIASIWDSDDNDNFIQTLINNNFIIIRNSVLEQHIFKAQTVPIVNGMKFIKDNCKNIEYVLQTRFDVLTNDYSKYLEKTEHLYREKITVITGIDTDRIYVLNIMVCGKLNDMYKFFNNKQYLNDYRSNEDFLLENYSKKTNLSKPDVSQICHFSLPVCIENNIEFIWIRSENWRNSFRTIPFMKVIQEYCTDTFIWTVAGTSE
jgi:hypothetical protein